MATPRRRRSKLPAGQQRFGAHVSVAGGLHLAFERATDATCDVLQVFVKNQRQWNAPPLTRNEITLWNESRRATGFDTVIAHNTYLINLGSADDGLWKRSVTAFVEELRRCEALSISHLVAHPGVHGGRGVARGIRRIARAINEIHRRTRGFRTRIALETTAGQGTSVGCRFEDIAGILGLTRESERLAVCMDTCHVFAAGYDLTTDEGCAATLAELDAQVGLDRLACVHVNDSKKPLGSRVDRHEHIGRGEIGLGAFRRLVNDTRLSGIPMILETPKGQDDRGRDLDRVNLARLRRLIRR